jgi:hypothetical protein
VHNPFPLFVRKISIMRFLSFFLVVSLSVPVLVCAQEPDVGGGAPRASTIPYGSVEEALADLKSKPDNTVELRSADNWLVVTEPNGVQWSFTPSTHEGYPALVRRAVTNGKEGAQTIQMAVLCQAEDAPCDRLLDGLYKADSTSRESFRTKWRKRD